MPKKRKGKRGKAHARKVAPKPRAKPKRGRRVTESDTFIVPGAHYAQNKRDVSEAAWTTYSDLYAPDVSDLAEKMDAMLHAYYGRRVRLTVRGRKKEVGQERFTKWTRTRTLELDNFFDLFGPHGYYRDILQGFFSTQRKSPGVLDVSSIRVEALDDA